MKLPEHLALSFLLAQLGAQQQYGRGGTALMLVAGCLPDLDVLTLLGGYRLYRTYHRIIGHGILVTLIAPILLADFGSAVLELGPFAPLWGWLLLALCAHLFMDVCFYRWPVLLLWPFTLHGWGWGLMTWNDLVPTLLLYVATFVALVWPGQGLLAGGAGILSLFLYLGWRACHPRPREGWGAWLTGDWADEAAPVWRWLTGDFLP